MGYRETYEQWLKDFAGDEALVIGSIFCLSHAPRAGILPMIATP